MKCISLWQPWATLMAIGAKRIETRSWATRFRGWLAIHAAQKWNKELKGLCLQEPFVDVFKMQRPNQADCFYLEDALKYILPLGHIIALVNVIDCVQIRASNTPSENERYFGDYTPGRFMWITNKAIKLPEPIPYRGSQGFFDVPISAAQIILQQTQQQTDAARSSDELAAKPADTGKHFCASANINTNKIFGEIVR